MTVLLVDDDATIRAMLRFIVESRGDQVIGEAEDGKVAMEASTRLKPDLVLLDVSMPEMGGFPFAGWLRKSMPEVAYIFVSQHRERSYVDKAIERGARGYVVKSAAIRELPVALDAFQAGGTYQSTLIEPV